MLLNIQIIQLLTLVQMCIMIILTEFHGINFHHIPFTFQEYTMMIQMEL